MAIARSKKGEILKELKNIFTASPTVVFVNFNGLNVAEAAMVRRDLRQAGVTYLVTKKSLVKKVLGESTFSGSLPSLPGELSLAFGSDLIEPARKIFSFKKKLENKLSIQGGIFEGRYVDAAEMIGIAQIPSRETLYAQFVNLINSPIQGLAVALDQIAQTKEKTA